jgi:hypothetical protein
MTNVGSISRVHLTLEISNKGLAQCEMIRHLSPLSVAVILKSLPLQDRIHKLADKLVYVETGLTIGAEKQKTQFKRGDMAYMTASGAICIFIKDSLVMPMNPIGLVKSNLDIIDATQAGDIIIIKR